MDDGVDAQCPSVIVEALVILPWSLFESLYAHR